MPITPPPFSARAISAPLTWRGPASPRSWVELRQHRKTRGAHGMALGDEAAGGVDRQLATRTGRPRFDELAALALGAEAHHLALVDLAEARGVVHLGDVDVLRPQP